MHAYIHTYIHEVHTYAHVMEAVVQVPGGDGGAWVGVHRPDGAGTGDGILAANGLEAHELGPASANHNMGQRRTIRPG